ncbi:MAG: hypothetical protein WCK57_09300 [Verrucomicrobiae bacterium]
MESIIFVKERATKTIAAAQQLAAQWTWQEKTIPQMKAALTAITGDNTVTPPVIGQEKTASAAEKAMTDARALWDKSLDQLHRLTMQGVSMAKSRYRNDPVKLALVENLTARGDSRPVILDEALEWETAWNEVEPTWNPLPANTLTAFGALRAQCLKALQDDYKNKNSAWREQAGILNQLVANLEDMNVAWYSDATDVFAEGTAEGDMIRGTIPTTCSPPPPKPAANPTPPAPKPA